MATLSIDDIIDIKEKKPWRWC